MRRALSALRDWCELDAIGVLLQNGLQAEEYDDGRERTEPDFHQGHVRIPARYATQRNQTQPIATPHAIATALPLATYP